MNKNVKYGNQVILQMFLIHKYTGLMMIVLF